jgi:ankyrin repeat protein
MKMNINHLFVEIQNRNNSIVQAFLENESVNIEDNYGRTVLLNAALYGNIELVEWVIEKGANINHTDKNGYSALHFAAQENHTNVVKFLIEKNISLDIQDKNGNTPAWVTIMYWNGGKNFDILQALIDANADLSLKNKANRAAIDMIPEKIKEQLKLKYTKETKNEQNKWWRFW